MSKFKDEIAQKLFEHLDRTLSKEVKAQLTPMLASEIIYHTTDFVMIEKFNSIFDQAIGLHKALVESQKESEEEDDDGSFLSELKKL